MYCGRCGVYNDDSHAYCENCGNRLAGETVGHAAAPLSAAATATGCSYSLSQGILLLIMILGVVFWAHISEKKEYRELITMGISIWKRRITRRLKAVTERRLRSVPVFPDHTFSSLPSIQRRKSTVRRWKF